MLILQWSLSQGINSFDDVKFEAASVLADLYEQQNQPSLSRPILRKAIELSQQNVYWHCRLIFQLAVSFEQFYFRALSTIRIHFIYICFQFQQIHAIERDYESATGLLGVGVDYANISNANYTKVLFMLSRCMVRYT